MLDYATYLVSLAIQVAIFNTCWVTVNVMRQTSALKCYCFSQYLENLMNCCVMMSFSMSVKWRSCDNCSCFNVTAVSNSKLLFTNPFTHPNCACFVLFFSSGLEWDLYKNVYGQHMVQDIVSEAVVKFLQNENPDRPLVLSFHGASGTGKSLVSSMIGRHIYGTAMGSPYIHQFVPTLHFPLANRVQQYRVCVCVCIS